MLTILPAHMPQTCTILMVIHRHLLLQIVTNRYKWVLCRGNLDPFPRFALVF